MQHKADDFLRQWRSAAEYALWFDNTHGRSTADLLALQLSATDRTRLLLKGGKWGLRGVHTTPCGSPITWLSRTITVPQTTVHAWLGYHADGSARCVRFFHHKPPAGSPATPDAPPSILPAPSIRELPITAMGTTAVVSIEGHPGLRSDMLFSTTDQELGNSIRLDLALRHHAGLPFSEDLVDLFLEHHPTLNKDHVAQAFGLTPRRWDQLVMGAWPSPDEVAKLRAFPDRESFFQALARQHPRRYGFAPATVHSPSWTNLTLRLNSTDPYPLGPAGRQRDVFSGYRRFSFERLAQLANHLAHRGRPSVQRLWCALFCADAIAFHTYGVGFTGMRYRWSTDGPVPELADERLARLCDEHIIRLSPSGKRADRRGPFVADHPFYYPPDYPTYWQAQELEQLLPADWPRIDLVHRLARRVRQARPKARADRWLYLSVPGLVPPPAPPEPTRSPLPDALDVLGHPRLMAFFQAVAASHHPFPAEMLLADLRRGTPLEVYFRKRAKNSIGGLTTELKVVSLSPRVFRITFGDHGPGYGSGNVWRVTFTPGVRVSHLHEEGFWIS